MFKLSLLPKVKRILRFLLQANDEIRPLNETLRKTPTTLCKSPWRVYGLLIIFSASGFPVKIKFQTATCKTYLPQNFRKWRRRRNFPFRKQAMPFSRHLEKILTINNFFSAKLEIKGNYVYNHPPLLPNIPFIPLHYQVDPPIFRKSLLQSETFLNVNDRVAPNNKKANRTQTSVNMTN